MQLAVHWIGALFAALLFVCAPALAQAPSPSERALATYEEGKKLYDAGDFSAARSKFIATIKVEPENPRWHYNLGLVQRQLDNYQAARQSLLRARELDPEYKRAEIDQKLVSMGFDPAAGTETAMPSQLANRSASDGEADDSTLGSLMFFGIFAGLAGLIIWLSVRARRRKSPVVQPGPVTGEVSTVSRQVDSAAAKLVQVEHALRLGEHADLRSQLDHATRIEQSVRRQLQLAAEGDVNALRKAKGTLGELERSAARAGELAGSIYGAQAFADHGERVACYFCARPLANADYRRLVAIKQADATANVVACPECAAVAAQGQAPSVLTGTDGRTHWSELSGFDPYTARHAAVDQTKRIPAWKFAPQRSFGELALLAGGAALAGGALAAMLRPEAQAASSLLDLDAAREAGLAQEAVRASAQHAAGQQRESFSDHS
jgi:tetratricopeptide (TPR) repeat protein